MKYKMVPARVPCWCNLTYHAVEQFIRRWAPDKSYESAYDELIALLHTSKQVDRTPVGDSIYVSGHRPEIRMVVKDRNVCVTVLPPGSLHSSLLDYQEEMEYLRAVSEEQNAKAHAEIAELQAQISVIDEERKVLSKKKESLANQLDRLRQKVKWDL